MRFLVDMNLSPTWCAILQAEGWDSVHWTDIGSPTASDQEVMRTAAAQARVILTHDLDFGAILAATQAAGPSIVQVRTHDVRPHVLSPLLVSVLRQHEMALDDGAIVVVDKARSRVRILPIRTP